jgi:hypothetical protein
VSHVFVAGGVVEEALVHCYDAGLSVYSESISGLEFALREVESELVKRGIAGGHAALTAYAADLPPLGEQERSRDESEMMLDEAMAQDIAALRLRVKRAHGRAEDDLDWFFRTYFRSLTGDMAIQWNDFEFDSGVYKFRTRNACLNLPQGFETVGTFRRSIAQQRPDLQFFSVGNAFFDAVMGAALRERSGRAYAIECVTRDGFSWAGFEFIFRTEAHFETLAEFPEMVNQANRVLAARRMSVFVGVDGKLADAVTFAVLRDLRNGLKGNAEGQQWWPLSSMHGHVLDQMVPGGWRQGVAALYAVALAQGRQEIGKRLEDSISAELRRISDARRLAQRDASQIDDAADEVAALDALERAVTNWRVELDAVGFLSVNGQVHGPVNGQVRGRR